MKVLKKLSVLGALAVCAVMVLTACGDKHIGKYSATFKLADYMGNVPAEIVAQVGDASLTCALELKKDNAFTLTVSASGVPDELQSIVEKMNFSQAGTYEIDGEKLILTVDGDDDSPEATIKDGKITINLYNEMTLELKK